MRPFHAVSLGLLLILLTVVAGGVDLLADPVGWALVLVGVRSLPPAYPLRTPLQYAAGLALLVSVPLVVPGVRDSLLDAGPALGWAVSLPTFLVLGLLAHAVATAASAEGDGSRATTYRVVEVGAVLVALLPVVVFGAGVDVLGPPAALLVVLVPVVLLVSLFLHSDRTWAGVPDPTATT